MKRFTSTEEIETLCEAMIKDFFKSRHYTNVHCVDIEAFVSDYLKVPIVYETFAEQDPGRLGFLADGKSALWIKCEDGKKQVIYPEGTAVIEKYLLSPGESARRRFTIAHEGAHDLLKRHVPIQSSPMAAFHSEFDSEMVYSGIQLEEMLSINEFFANRAAACLLMPGFLVKRVMKRHTDSKKVVMYSGEEGIVLAQDQKLLIQKMADTMGVSYTAFFIRLKELDLFETRPVEEYLRSGLGCGGVQYAGSD